MKVRHIVFVLLAALLIAPKSLANNAGLYDAVIPKDESRSGLYLGSNQGVLLFLGTSKDVMGPQYYSVVDFGYNMGDIVQPLIRFGQAIGSLNGTGSPTTFFLTVEGGVKITPAKSSSVTPYLIGSGGMYVLDFSDQGSPINNDTNWTFGGGGGLEFRSGSNNFLIGSAYRSFVNTGKNLRSLEITLGYNYQF